MSTPRSRALSAGFTDCEWRMNWSQFLQLVASTKPEKFSFISIQIMLLLMLLLRDTKLSDTKLHVALRILNCMITNISSPVYDNTIVEYILCILCYRRILTIQSFLLASARNWNKASLISISSFRVRQLSEVQEEMFLNNKTVVRRSCSSQAKRRSLAPTEIEKLPFCKTWSHVKLPVLDRYSFFTTHAAHQKRIKNGHRVFSNINLCLMLRQSI